MERKAELVAALALTLVFLALVLAIVLLQPAPRAMASIATSGHKENLPAPKVVPQPAPAHGPDGAQSSGAEAVARPEKGMAIAMPTAPAERRSVFDAPILGEFVEVVKTTSVIAAGNALLCSSGRLDACEMRSVNTSERVGNDTVFYPFRGRDIEELASGCERDEDDEYTIAHYNLTNLYACAAGARDVVDIFVCAIKFNRENGGMCLSSTSAFKLAYCASSLSRQEQPFKLYKAFVADGFNAHRFILLRNDNGFYSLDPLWCPSESREGIERCVEFSSRNFYDNPKAQNYRGIVKKIDRFA
ncbi:MAG: hypothetical protein QXG98_03760 [Candidatus Micrarchaeia archaeon]